MIRLPPRSTRTDTLFPSPPLFRSEQSVERVVEPGVRRPFEHRPRALGPALGRGDRQRFLRYEMVKESPLRHPRRDADLVDAGGGIALSTHGPMRRGDQIAADVAARRPCRGGAGGRSGTRRVGKEWG